MAGVIDGHRLPGKARDQRYRICIVGVVI